MLCFQRYLCMFRCKFRPNYCSIRPFEIDCILFGGVIMFVTFGEAMLRLSPVNDGPAMYGRGNPSARAAFMRAVGGDELNVSVRRFCACLLAVFRLGRRVAACGLRSGCIIQARKRYAVGVSAAIRTTGCANGFQTSLCLCECIFVLWR